MPLLETLEDSFTGALDLTKWPHSYGDPSAVGGRGRIPCTVGGFAGLRSATTYTLTGSHFLLRAFPPAANGATVTAALSVLLLEGIGDTIRISLTPEPGGDRTREVIVAQEILQTTGLRAFVPLVAACPGCGRTTSTYFQELAESIQGYVRNQMLVWREEYEGVENMTLAVMGCVVNGPGESKHANIGISLPGSGERPVAPVYVDGQKAVTLKGDNIAGEFRQIVDEYVQMKYPKKSVDAH